MQTYQSKFTGKQIDDAIDKISQMQTSIQNNANQITSLKSADTSIKNSVTAVGNRVTELEEKTDTYEFDESLFNSLTSDVGLVVPISSTEIEKYRRFIVNFREENSEDRAKTILYYQGSTTISGKTTYTYANAGATVFLQLTYNTSTTMIAKFIVVPQ